MTHEHIIPDSIGGKLTSNFLCKPCNDNFGAKFDVTASNDPAIRIAIQHLYNEIPDLALKIEEGQRLIIKDERGVVPGFVKDGAPRVEAHKASDGSLVMPTEAGRKSLSKMLVRQQHSEEAVAAALAKFDSAPDNASILISRDIEAVKWTIHELKLDLSRNSLMHSVVLLKIAYEFLALHIGSAIYADTLPLQQIRHCLISGENLDEICTIERLSRGKYEPIHGITCRANFPNFVILVMFFGELVFRVTFPTLGFEGKRFCYVHLIKTGQENCFDLSDPAFAHLNL